ncbi:RNA polymerase II mediator complex subunit [Apophysomyces ossiformis]|uniref:Mediator of RNA polymerase II transcription subunit 12 n=1 Tax=Apophysomyces ossiformis TaxID=679940 RepID=A0A8H7BQ63_9FUNG|nr:RNA polymerase II mediator complex subunit [Apophysomyces ossiformis]
MPKYGTHTTQLKKYTLQPPARQLPLSKSMPQLGYPGMFPQRPTQDEDILTESNVRNGFIDRPTVPNEHTCAHDIVYGKLQDDPRLLNELGVFMVDVLNRKRKAARITGNLPFKPPTRSTLVDPKREHWMQELANAVVPLRKLARNAPHGFKGEKLLDALAARQVPFLRATWYIKIVGLSEMAQRNASNATLNTSQSQNWTQTVMAQLKKQLGELSQQPSTSGNSRGYKMHPGTPNHSDPAQKPWATPESRARFEQRWSYSTRLARWQYCEGLLDQRTFLRTSLEMFASSTSFETVWLVLTGVIQDYVDEYRRNRTLMKILIEHLIKAYSALLQHEAQAKGDGAVWPYHGLQLDIEQLLRSLFLSTPDMFVVPKLYHQYRTLFDKVLGGKLDTKAENCIPDLCHVLRNYWSLVKARNEVFCGTLEENRLQSESGKQIPQPTKSIEENPGQDIADEQHIVHILDSIGRYVDNGSGLLIRENHWMDARGQTASSAAKSIFGSGEVEQSAVVRAVEIMCRWATSEFRHGDWRAFLIYSILLNWRDQDKGQDRKTILQDALIHFLDSEILLEEDTEEYNVDIDQGKLRNTPVTFLFDTLIRLHLFSYQRYLLRLIARGDLEPGRRTKRRMIQCLQYLESFPMLIPAPAYLVNQRRVALYGAGSDPESQGENEVLARLKRLAKQAITGCFNDEECLFGQDAKDMTQPDANDTFASFELALSDKIEEDLKSLMSTTTRYTIIRFTHEWLLEEVKRFVVKSVPIGEDNWRVMTSPGSCLLNARQYVTIIKILDYAKDYLSIIEVTLWVLEKTNERALYPFIVDTLQRYASVWRLVHGGDRIASAVWKKLQILQTRDARERCLIMFMVQLVQEGFPITEEMRIQLQQDLQIKQKIRGRYHSSIPVVTELTQFANNPTLSAVETVAGSLCSRFQGTPGWIGSLLDIAVDILRQTAKEKNIPASNGQGFMSQAYFEFHRTVSGFAQLLKEIADQITISGQLDDIIIQWLSQQCNPSSSNKTPMLEDIYLQYSWIPLFVTSLVVSGLTNIDSMIRGFALPWFKQIGQAVQQQCESEWTEATDETENRLQQACKNLVVMIRLLVVQEQCGISDNSWDPSQLPWVLRNEEIFRLQVQRKSQLASSLSSIEPMFSLMESLVLIATNLPLSSSLLQELVMLRADLLQIDWFRQGCIRDLNGVYQRFSIHETESVTEKKIKKKMLCIVDELLGADLCDDRRAIVKEEPDFIGKLHRVFSNITQWNEEQCRVQVNLLLDNILLSDDDGTEINSPQILGDDVVMTSPSPSLSGTQHNKYLEKFVKFFFDVVLSNDKDAKAQRRAAFLRNLVHELREPIVLELLRYGVQLLHGNAHSPFPENVLLPDSLSDSSHHSQAYLSIMQHLMAEDVWTNDKKIELVKLLHKQIKRFRSAKTVFKVMQGARASFADATRALQLSKNNVDMAIALLVSEGLPDNDVDEPKVMLHDLRTRLRLVVPFVSLIWEHPKEEECDILEWIRVLVPLLGNPLIHGNSGEERLFEFVLDLVSLLIDEVPKDLRKTSLSHLSAMHSELLSVPPMFHSRVKRILPFSTHNVYLNNTRLSSAILGLSSTGEPQQQQQHLEACMEQSKPWEWLEDYFIEKQPENDVAINLSFFNARKTKRMDGTYVRWFKFGFEAGIGNDQFARVCSLGKRRQQKSVDTTDDSNFVYIVDDEDIRQSPAKKRQVDVEEGEIL